MRVLSSDVKGHIGKTVHIEGWLHKKRLLGGLTFINVRDRKGLVQVVIQDKDEVEKLRGLQIGTVLAVDGMVFMSSRRVAIMPIFSGSEAKPSGVTQYNGKWSGGRMMRNRRITAGTNTYAPNTYVANMARLSGKRRSKYGKISRTEK